MKYLLIAATAILLCGCTVEPAVVETEESALPAKGSIGTSTYAKMESYFKSFPSEIIDVGDFTDNDLAYSHVTPYDFGMYAFRDVADGVYLIGNATNYRSNPADQIRFLAFLSTYDWDVALAKAHEQGRRWPALYDLNLKEYAEVGKDGLILVHGTRLVTPLMK